jgi:hypothetical protein
MSSSELEKVSDEVKVNLKAESAISFEVTDKYIRKNSPEVTNIKGNGAVFTFIDLKTKEPLDYRVRFEKPLLNKRTGKKQRYGSKKGNRCKVYCIPDHVDEVRDSNRDIFLIEGEKKLLSLISQKEFNNHIAAAYTGCSSWCEKDSGGELSDEWKEINFKNRNVHLLPDTDFFTNHHVYNEIIKFIKALLNQGAEVSLYDLRIKGSNDKVGVDDFIVRKGSAELEKILSKPLKRFRKIQPLEYFNYDKDLFLNSLMLLDNAETAELLDELSNLHKGDFSKTTTKLLLAKEREKWNKLKPKFEGKDKELVWYHTEDPISKLLKKMRDEVLKVPNLYRNADSNSFIHIDSENGSSKIYSSPKDLSALFANHFAFRRACMKEGEVKLSSYEPIPDRLIHSYLEDEKNFQKIKKVNFVTSTPQVVEGYIVKEKGYDEKTGVFLLGDSVKPIKGLKNLTKLINSFPFSTDIDKRNFLGVLISLLFTEEYRGQHPSIVIKGDKQNLGKTTLAEVISLLFQNKEPASIALTYDEELKKAICGIVKESNVVLIDNIKRNGKASSNISSPVLENFITSRNLNFRLLGENKIMERPNNVHFMLTLNAGSFSPDLNTRSVFLSLSEKNSDAIDYSFCPKSYVKSNRDKILGEILFMINNYLEKKDSYSFKFESKNKFFKFRKWESLIGQILEVNKFGDFMSNQDSIREKANPIIDAIRDYLYHEINTEFKNVFKLSSGDIAKRLPPDVFPEDSSLITKAMAVSKAINNCSSLDTVEYRFNIRKVKSNIGGQSFCFEFKAKKLDALGTSEAY